MAKQTDTLNLNEADTEEIVAMEIDLIDEDTADEIVMYRDENGPFESWIEVRRVPGMTDAKVEKLRGSGATLGESAHAEHDSKEEAQDDTAEEM